MNPMDQAAAILSALPTKTIKQKFILDESGSMLPQQQTIISGFNEQLDTMKAEEIATNVRYLITLTKFSDKAEMVYRDLPLAEVPRLTSQTYSPNGWTALYDAIGMSIDTAAIGETDAIITIMTDGEDNRSREWKKLSVKTIIELRQRENKWGFVFFGANQDAWLEAESLGVLNAVNYSAVNTGNTMRAMSCARSAYTTNAQNESYTVSGLTNSIDESELV